MNFASVLSLLVPAWVELHVQRSYYKLTLCCCRYGYSLAENFNPIQERQELLKWFFSIYAVNYFTDYLKKYSVSCPVTLHLGGFEGLNPWALQ